MAGMFYSLKEAAAKLNKTEEEVKELAKQGKLREFRDGSNLLFKIDEVEALMADMSDTAAQEELPPMEEAEEFAEAAEPEMTFEPEEMEASEFEQAQASEQPFEPEEEMAAEEIGETEEQAAEAEKEEILLAPDSGSPAADADLSSADTALTSKGVNILGETDHDYQLTDDTMAETTITPGTGTGTGGTAGVSGTTGEAMLEEIEDDVTMDSFGSGSGLLDLSLQADDTSLGGILDEIYTSEGGEGGEEGQEPAEEPSTVEMAAEVESAPGGIQEEVFVAPPVSMAPEVSTLAQPYTEAPPDALSNSLGIMLFLPLLALIYAGIIIIAGVMDVMPAILSKIKTPYLGLYLMAGFSIASLLTFGVSFMLSGGFGAAGTKEKKPKKPKKVKPKKEKKAKKGKKAAKEEAAE